MDPTKILPEGAASNVNIHPLITIGMTDNNEIGIVWPNDNLRRNIVDRFTTAQIAALKDYITIALRQSMDKRMPTIFTVS
jgi:hypothetical protein